MGNQDKIQLEGEVIEALPNAMFRIKTDGSADEEPLILAHLSGKMRVHYIKIIPGDRVIVELSPYDLTRGRIIRRL